MNINVHDKKKYLRFIYLLERKKDGQTSLNTLTKLC